MLHPSDPGSRRCAPEDFGRLTGLSCLPRRAPASRAAGPGGGCCSHAGGAVAAGGAGCCGGGARPGIVGVGAAHCLRHRPLRQADAAGARAYVLEFRLGQGRARACAERGGRGQWRHAVWPVGKILPWELGQSPAVLRFWQSPEAAAAKPHPASAVSGCLGRTDASVLQPCNPSGQRSVSNPAAARVGQDSLQCPEHHPKPAQQTKRPVAYGPMAPPFWLQQPQHPQQIQQLQQLGPLSGRLASRSSCQTPGSASVCTVIVAAFGFAPMLGHWQDLGNASMGSRPQPARPRVPHVALPDAPRVLPPRARCRGCGDWRSPT